MQKYPFFISKTRYLEALQCLKLLWYRFNRKNEIPSPTPEQLEVMKQGTLVGKLAHNLFPEGITLKRDWNAERMDKKSFAALENRKPLFEPGFTFNQTYAIADILSPQNDNRWDLIEVKSSTSVKAEHYPDLAFQKYVYTGRGLRINRCYLMHLNREYVRQGALEPEQLFKKEDLTRKVDEYLPEVEKNLEEILKIISGEEPDVKISSHCNSPYACPLNKICLRFLPEDHILQLRGNKQFAYDLIEQGIYKMNDIPEGYDLTQKQLIQINSHKTKESYVDREYLRAFLDELAYPLYFLDFETIAPAIPIYDSTRPFEEIPFQFSLHVVESPTANPVHHAYLAPGEVDPRSDVLCRLKELLGEKGSIVAYNARYEQNCLSYSARAYPEYTDWVEKVNQRFVDLLAPFKNLFYYHPSQNGSASMKKVLPALTGSNYEHLDISNGSAARYEYMRITFEKDITTKDRQQVRDWLEKYCEQDTRGMLEILQALRKELNFS